MAKGPTRDQIRDTNVERREYLVTKEILLPPSSRVWLFNCPFCKDEVKAYVWSISGSGKRCTCGALFYRSGLGYNFKTNLEKG